MALCRRTFRTLLLVVAVTAAAGGTGLARAMFWGALYLRAAPFQQARDARIFLSLTNTSKQEQSFTSGPMCALTDLVVTDATGKVQVPAAKTDCGANAGSPSPAVVRLPSNGLYKGSEFAQEPAKGEPLALWGYALGSGTYRVYAIPAKSLWPDRAFVKEPVTSDEITLTLN